MRQGALGGGSEPECPHLPVFQTEEPLSRTSTSLHNRRATVSGPVQGAGLVMARELARAGAGVVLSGLSSEAAHAADA